MGTPSSSCTGAVNVWSSDAVTAKAALARPYTPMYMTHDPPTSTRASQSVSWLYCMYTMSWRKE